MKINHGFTLIEVLITVVISAIGLLGLAAVQATGLRNNLTAYQRSQATQLAYDMADRVRANVADAEKASGVYATAAKTAALTEANDVQAACKTSTGCSATLMAENDIYEWNNEIDSILPGGEGTIVFSAPVYTITINWDDDRDSNTAALSFQMSFQL